MVSLALAVAGPATAAPSPLTCLSIDIDGVGPELVETYRATPALSLEMDDVLFLCDGAASLVETEAPTLARWHGLEQDDLFIVRAAHPGREQLAGVRVLARGGPYAIVEATNPTSRQNLLRGLWPDAQVEGDGCHRPWIRPFDTSEVLARQAANHPRRGSTPFGPAASEAAAAVDFDRWFAAVETLAQWNRYTLGSEIAAASDWLVSQFSALGLPVTTPTFQVGGATANNVVATWTGTTRPNDWYLVGAHYDAISQNPSVAAPGAEDNASGCAGVLELARVLVPRQPEATVIFLCYSGEEQGLFGSTDHARDLVAAGDRDKIQGVLTMDMIGYSGDSDLDVLLETEPAFESVLAPYADAAASFTTLRVVTSLNAFGSDHVPYLNRNLPALLTIENDWDSYGSYHTTSDLPANVNRQMGGQIVRMNAAVLAHQSGAGGNSVIFLDGFESGTLEAWASSEP